LSKLSQLLNPSNNIKIFIGRVMVSIRPSLWRTLNRQIAQVDEEIDQRVYALYGLSAEEIRVVEGKV
jgi:hypothetical protein